MLKQEDVLPPALLPMSPRNLFRIFWMILLRAKHQIQTTQNRTRCACFDSSHAFVPFSVSFPLFCFFLFFLVFCFFFFSDLIFIYFHISYFYRPKESKSLPKPLNPPPMLAMLREPKQALTMKPLPLKLVKLLALKQRQLFSHPFLD